MKKILKISIAILFLIFSILISLPFIFEGKLISIVKENINANINATADFESLDLSLISNFPNAEISLNNLLITNLEPFKGDTLVRAKNISLNIPLLSLFKINSGKIDITSFLIDEGKINITIDKQGNANYDITKKNVENADVASGKSKSNSSLLLDHYQIINSSILYKDETSGLNLILNNFNHSGSGNLSTAISELKTETNTTISFKYNNETYLNNNTIRLSAVFGIDLDQNKYSFLENKVLINQLPLEFDGYLQLNEKNQELDITFKTASAEFKNFLALIPETYSKDISNVKTTGKFTVKGFAKGIIDEKHLPKFDIQFTSKNASFKYPDLPKTVNNIHLNTAITNSTGITNDTKIDIKKLSFTIDNQTFNSNALISNLIENPTVKMNAKGTVNLSNLNKAYPMEEIKELQGILKTDFKASFDMKSIEQKNYTNLKNSGVLSLTNFKYDGDETTQAIEINNAQITFNTKSVDLNNFDAKTGNSDFKINGVINNLIGFIFNEETIKGDFNLASNNFDVSDFMEIETKPNESTEVNKTTEKLKIPSFLDCTFKAKAANVVYDNLNLKNVKGTLVIKDEKATISNLSAGLFDGEMAMNGFVSTKEDIPTFSLNLDIAAFDINQSFSELDLFGALAPIGSLVQGKINTDLNISGFLNPDLTPNLTSVTGNALSEIAPSKATLQNSKAMSLLHRTFSFIDLNKLDFNKLKAAISFENGQVAVHPFNIKYKDIDIEISGKHGFDNTMDYNLDFDIPAKYLGTDVANLLNNLNEDKNKELSIPISTTLVGTFSNPTLKTNMDEAINKLTNQLMNQQKNKLIKQGEDELSKLLNGNSKSKDSIKTNSTTEAAKSLLNSLFKKKKKDN